MLNDNWCFKDPRRQLLSEIYWRQHLRARPSVVTGFGECFAVTDRKTDDDFRSTVCQIANDYARLSNPNGGHACQQRAFLHESWQLEGGHPIVIRQEIRR